MLSSSVLTYADAAAYARDMPGLAVELHPTAAGEFKATTTLISLHQLSTARFADNLPRVMYTVPSPKRTLISFKVGSGPELVWEGLQMHSTTILQHTGHESYFQRSAGEASWGYVSLPLEMMEGSLTALAGRDLTAASHTMTLVPTPIAIARLQRLHAACCAMAEHGPELLTNPDAARGIEQALTESLAACLGTANGHGDVKNSCQGARTMRRFRSFVEDNADRAIYIGEISAAVGVSGRALRACCKEYLGMGATQYLTLRRMHLVRSSLCFNSPTTSTVTEAATCYGFWELGRFSVNYKALFGEHPVQTLRCEQIDEAPFGEPICTTAFGSMAYH